MLSIRISIRSIGLLAATAVAACTALAGSPAQQKPDATRISPSDAQKRADRNNARFIQNNGQWDSTAKFLARSKGLNAWFTSSGITYDYFRVTRDKSSKSVATGQVINMTFVGGRQASLVGADEKPIDTDFMFSRGSKVRARSFGEAVAKGVYPGIDVVNYYDHGATRYDFMVAPGADPRQIKLAFNGANSVKVKSEEIVLGTKVGDLRQGKLVAYQTVDGLRKPVKASFRSVGNNVVAINVGPYDHSRMLVIDPLVYGSYYGGDNGMDAVTAVTTDTAGGVYMTGWTMASQFPSIQGPYGFNVKRQDSFVSKLQGDAYHHDYACYLGGSNDDYAQYIKLDPSNNVWVMGRTTSCDFPGNTRPNVQFLQVGVGGANGGTFQLIYGNLVTDPLPYNATPAQVQTALSALPGFAGKVQVTSFRGGLLPAASAIYRIELDCTLPRLLTVNNVRTTTNGREGAPEINEGLANVLIFRPYLGRPAGQTTQEFVHRGSLPTPGVDPDCFVKITFASADGGVAQTPFTIVGPPPAFLPAGTLQGVLQALSDTGTNSWQCTGGPQEPTTIFVRLLGGIPPIVPNVDQPLDYRLTTDNSQMWPKPQYEVVRFTDIWLIEFKQSATQVLDPLPTRSLFFGDEYADEMPAGFGIIPKINPSPTDPIDFAFTGDTTDTASQVPGPQRGNSYIMRYTYNPVSGTFLNQVAASKWLDDPATEMGGLDVDAEGSVYIAGMVFASANFDTSVNPVFTTTPGVFQDGRLLRRTDLFVRKYAADGSLVYSALIGGNNDDAIGGHLYRTLQYTDEYMGSAIAVDRNLNIYVTGISFSFNFPRTRGVFGEVFDNNQNVTVTKINSDCSQIVYSTNLKTTGFVDPSGIAVDTRGDAFITGNIGVPGLIFPDSYGGPPSDPNEPTSIYGASGQFPLGSGIQTTPDALDPDWTSPVPPEAPTTEGWINVLDETGTQLIYGSYIGGYLDDCVYGPYVDSFGDVWIMGWTDSARSYYSPYIATPPGNLYQSTGGLPASLISPLAFKSSGDAAGSTGQTVAYGALSPTYPFIQPWLPFITMNYNRDGFIIKKRIFLPTVKSVVLNPATIPGGLGASSVGTVTLSSAAPTGGADVSIDLNNTTAASLDPSATVGSIVITIPQGQTTGTFTIYTNPVVANTQVQVKATYQGSFQIAQATVIPWLQQLALTPTSVVGGNSVLGRVTLAAPAPSTGVDVALLTDSPSLISFPIGSTFTVPAGQTSANFTIDTNGVASQTDVSITASLLGVGKTQTLTLRNASLASVTFNPNRVAGGSTSTGTVTLDGKAGSTFVVNLTIDSGTPGYILTPSVTFNAGDTQKTFTVQTVYEAANTQRKITATRPAQGAYALSTAQGTLFIDAVNLTGLSFNPTTVNSGATSVGTVTISAPAPAGGVIVSLSSANPTVVQVPATVTIPTGDSQVTFNATTTVVGATTPVVVTATRGPVVRTATLTVRGVNLSLSINPTSVIGGNQNAVGTVTLVAAAGAGGLTVNLSSNDASASVPASVTVLAGQTTANFTITTVGVATTRNVTITATLGTNVATATLQVRPNGVNSIVFVPSVIRGLQTTTMTVTLDAVAPGGGAVVSINRGSNPQIANIPLSVTVPAGATSVSVTVTSRRVSRTLATQVTATYSGKSASTLLTVTR